MRKLIPTDSVLVPDVAQRVFEGVIYDTYQWQQKLFDNSLATFEMLKRPDTVTAICIVDGKLLVIEEEQPHSGSKISFPGGRIDDTDDSPLAAIKREVQEETGYSFQNWRLVSVKQFHTKVEWFIHYFLATDAQNIGPTNHDAGEKIELKQMSFAHAKKLSLQGVRFVSESREIFEQVNNLAELLDYPEFAGTEVDR